MRKVWYKIKINNKLKILKWNKIQMDTNRTTKITNPNDLCRIMNFYFKIGLDLFLIFKFSINEIQFAI